jgi:hypothetical protein
VGIHRRRAELHKWRDSNVSTRADERTMVIDQRSYSDTIHEESIVEILYSVLFDARDRSEFFEFHVSLERDAAECNFRQREESIPPVPTWVRHRCVVIEC